MKRVLSLTLALLLAVTISCTEKQPEISHDLVQPRLDDLRAKLSLTDEQVQKITPIIADATAKLKDMMENPPEDFREGRENMRIFSDSIRGCVSAVLTGEQNAQFESHRMAFTPSTTVIELYEKLKLTPEQIHWVDSVGIAFRIASAELREGTTRETFDREAMTALRKQYSKDIGELFTAGQWEIYDKLQAERMGRRGQGGGRGGGH